MAASIGTPAAGDDRTAGATALEADAAAWAPVAEPVEPGARMSGTRAAYEVGAEVGRANGVRVWRAVRVADRSPVALHMLGAGVTADAARRMLRAWAAVGRHANLVALLDTVRGGIVAEPHAPDAVDLLELCASRGLMLSFGEARAVFARVAAALAHCHLASVAHRDVKADNVLVAGALDGGPLVVKLTDFALATRVPAASGALCDDYCGTPLYAPPQVLCNHPYDARAGDVWAFAVSLYVAVAGDFPWRGTTDAERLAAASRGDWARLLRDRLGADAPPELVALLSACLRVDERTRPSADAVLLSPWFASGTNSAGHA